jgi:hypothetical protein
MSTFFGALLVVGLVFGVPFWLVKYVGSRFGPTDDFQNVGIKGWLALLIALIGIVSPLYLAGILYSGFDDLERSYPAVLRFRQYLSYKSITIFISAVVILVQMYSAWRLLVSRDYSAVIFLKKYLLVSPFLAFCYPLLGSFYFSDMGFAQWNEAINGFVGASVVNAAWYLYLSKSKRVSATYCRLERSSLSHSAPHEGSVVPFIFRTPSSVGREEISGELITRQILESGSPSHNNSVTTPWGNDKSFSGISNLERVYV